MSIASWIRQPTTIIGLGTCAGTVGMLTVQATSGQISWPVAAFGLGGALVMLVLPDNTTAKADAGKLAEDVATAIITKNAAALPNIAKDTAAVLTDVTKKGV